MIYGIDIGLSGAIALFDEHGAFVNVYDLPVMQMTGSKAFVKNAINAGALYRFFKGVTKAGDMAYVEALSPMPKNGVGAIFSQGMSYGAVTAVLQTLSIPFLLIRPHVWKKTMGLGKGKEEARGLAIRLVPEAAPFLSRKKDHNRAESVLIAKYGLSNHPPTG